MLKKEEPQNLFQHENDQSSWWQDNGSKVFWIFVAGLLLLLLAVGGYDYHQRQRLAAQTAVLNHLQDQVDALSDKNNRTIYLPQPGDFQVSPEQKKSMDFLNRFFSSITDFSSQSDYNTNYREAKSAGISDPYFWNKFMEKPYDKDGMGTVDAEHIKFRNIRTQVLLNGPSSYIVIVTYVPYRNSSDLYQLHKLQTQTYFFDVHGVIGHWDKMRVMSSMDANAKVIRVGDLDN